MLEQMKVALQEAQTEKARADIALMEATAQSQAANEAATRLESAVAALTGEKVAAEPPVPLRIEDTRTGESFTVTPVAGEVIPTASQENGPGEVIEQDNDARRQMNHEEWEADRVARQRRAKRKAKLDELANNPLSHLKCPGCGVQGSLQDTMTQAPSGAMVRMMVCHKCNNQIMH